jgi:hypothetical protein
VGWVAEREYLQRVCNEFHARVSWRLPDHEEPVLGPFDPEAVIEEEELDAEEERSQRERVELLNVVSDCHKVTDVVKHSSNFLAHSPMVPLSYFSSPSSNGWP